MEAQDFTTLDVALKNCDKIDIAVKLRRNAETMHLKL